MIFYHTIFLVIVFTFSLLPAIAENTIQRVVQFDQSTYRGARQNWCVSAGSNGKIYFANHTGLLAFDGTNWNLNRLPNQTIMRSLKTGSDSLIFTGGFMELGYWKEDSKGNLEYHSLTPEAQQYFSNNIEFWNIATEPGYTYYQSFSKILVYHNQSISKVNLEGQISVMNQVGDRILASVYNNGIFEIRKNKVIPFIVDDKLNNKTVKFLIPLKGNQVLIGTAAHGILLWDGEKLSEWNPKWTTYFIENELNRGHLSEDGKVIIGTLVDGIVVFNQDGSLLFKVNTKNGLPNNTVLGIETDEWHNIWLALDIGIAFVSSNQQQDFELYEIPGTGAIYSTALFENKMYLGTNHGLFVKSPDLDDPNVTLVPETQDQIWDLKIIDDELLIGHNQGSMSIKDGKVKWISNVTGALNFVEDPYNPNLVLQSTYNSLLVYEKTKDGLLFRNQIQGFANLIRYIEFDHMGNLWASHMHRGIFKIQVNDARDSVLLSPVYYGKETFGKDHSIHVFNVEKRIVFTTGEMLFTYDDLNDSIIPYSMLNEGLGKYKVSHRIVEAPNHHYWFIGKEFIGLFSIFQDEIKLIREFPTTLFNDRLLVDGYENLLPLDENSAILCLQNGIAQLNASVSNDSTRLIERYKPNVRHIELSNNTRTMTLPLDAQQVKIRHNFNTLNFRFSFPFLSELPVSYRYFLEGINQEWSDAVAAPDFRFERLPRGHYNLKVKAVDLWGNESQTFSFAFEILPPISASKWAIFFYTLIGVTALFMFRRWGIRQTRKKEQRQHEKRERELIRLGNEKLRDEVQFKSKDLANSTMAIIRKNEFLLDLKKIIKKHKEELGSRYPDKYFNYVNRKIDENISSRDDRQIFESNFERAHEQFFQKMKNKYPELTSGDLQLCAYLRMNLSSKEIAPLLGISVRGVENHRYRLRKKMKLEHDESLTDTILGF